MTESAAKLKRRIQALENRNVMLQQRIDRDFAVYRDNLHKTVDMKTKLQQIQEILNADQ
jgi:pyrimidine operon attenuation protein/uracil phosphoribosyltransferase